MRILTVLMWKHVTVRKRRFLQTIVEFVVPLLCFLMVYGIKDISALMRDDDAGNSKNSSTRRGSDTEAIPMSASWAQPLQVVYLPNTPIATRIMDKAAIMLQLIPRVEVFPIDKTQLPEIEANLGIKRAIVIFQNMTGTDFPLQLNYTIKMKEPFGSNIYGVKSILRNHYNNKFVNGLAKLRTNNVEDHILSTGLNSETFLRIQWAIDASYIMLRTGNKINQTVYLRHNSIEDDPTKFRLYMILGALCLFSYFSLLLNFVFTTNSLYQEKASGIKELMKMVGIPIFTMGFSRFLNAIPAALVYAVGGTVILKVTDSPVIQHSSSILIFIFLLLYYNSIIALAFVCSQFIPSSMQNITSTTVLLYAVSGVATLIEHPAIPDYLALALGLLPHKPMVWFWFEVIEKEMYGKGVQFSTIFESESPDRGSPFTGYLFLIIQACVFYLLSWYLSFVNPGKYGQPMPWNFIFDKYYWTKRELRSTAADFEEFPPILHEGVYFEAPPSNMTVGIRVDNVTKVYPKQVALKGVSLEVYKGEITVLLGHNGAGKTTLMSVITGMTPATSGKVLVNGIDTVTERNQIHKHLGLCPQHNLFFPDLNVLEHVIFFAALKKANFKEGRQSAKSLLERLNLKSKKRALISHLSGGMKRRVQIACALAGDAEVLILDEPTSGLDVQTRRELWDVLHSFRGDRTVLLTTHFMEEADALGDRVAVLYNGELRSFATTMYLKKQIGTGYRLTLVTIGLPREPELTALVTSHVHSATHKESTINTITYSLPVDANEQFPPLFNALEAKKAALGIDSIGIGVSTLDEVFLKLCSDLQMTSEIEIDPATVSTPDTKKRVTGCALYLRQFIVLLKRQLKYLYSKKWMVLIVQILIPLAVICALTYNSNNHRTEKLPARRSTPLNLDVLEKPERLVLYNQGFDNTIIEKFRDRYPQVDFQNTAKGRRSGTTFSLENNTYLIGFEVNNVNATAVYNTSVRLAAPVALNMMSNLFASRYIPDTNTSVITTHYQPLYDKQNKIGSPKSYDNIIRWTHFITYMVIIVNIMNVSLPCKERETGARHIHIMSGCPPELYWGTTLLFHTAFSLFLVIIPLDLFILMLENDQTLNQPMFLLTLTIIYFLGSLAVLAFMYLVSFNFAEKTTSIVLIVGVVVFGLFTPLVKVFKEVNQTERDWYYTILQGCYYLNPFHTLSEAVFKAALVAQQNGWCIVTHYLCVQKDMIKVTPNLKRCCDGPGYSYFAMSRETPFLSMNVLLVQFIIFMILVLITQRGIIKRLRDLLLNRSYKPPVEDESGTVLAEKKYVKHAISLPTPDIPDAMLVDNVHKRYVPLCWKKFTAVRGVSFSVKKGECFCVLGVNGAGKSSTFKLITTEECPTRGRLFANGHHLKTGVLHYMYSIGYCPQFFGLDMFLTGEEYLTMVLTLRGLDKECVKNEATTWIDTTGLTKYAHRTISKYSGGCVRRLAAAAALCGGAAIVLLDEPTTGVDVTARRRLWTAIRRAQHANRSVIITSHSLDEVEALSSRIAIMSAGRVRALGSAPELRAAYATGHAIVLKFKPAATSKETFNEALENLKSKLEETFDCTLKDEHLTMLHYHINETLPYSRLFSQLETLKQQFGTLLEDYSVTETTLEEVFLSFAKEDQTRK